MKCLNGKLEVDNSMSDNKMEYNLMEGVIKLKVPIIVDAKQGDNWGEMEKIN